MTNSRQFFDLDGTVCNTLQDLAECTNRALADFGLPPHQVEAYRMMSGNGVDTQMKAGNRRRKNIPKSWQTRSRQNLKPTMTGIISRTPARMKEWSRRWMHCAQWDSSWRSFPTSRMSLPERFARSCLEIALIWWQAIARASRSSRIRPVCLPLSSVWASDRRNVCTVATPGGCRHRKKCRDAGHRSEWGFRGRKELEENHASYVVDHPEDILKFI